MFKPETLRKGAAGLALIDSVPVNEPLEVVTATEAIVPLVPAVICGPGAGAVTSAGFGVTVTTVGIGQVGKLVVCIS